MGRWGPLGLIIIVLFAQQAELSLDSDAEVQQAASPFTAHPQNKMQLGCRSGTFIKVRQGMEASRT